MTKPKLGRRFMVAGAYHRYIDGERARAREAILNVIDKSKYEKIDCLCGSKDESTILAEIDRWGLPCRELLCPDCGLIRVSPRWEDKVYASIYQQYFWPLQSGCKVISRDRFNLSMQRSRETIEYVCANLELRGKLVLEIGCSYGAALIRLKESGAKLVGFDWDKNILAAGREYTGLDLRYGGIDSALEEYEGKADVVILRHVFEHMLHPLNEAEKLANLLSPEGRVYIEVPGSLSVTEYKPDPIGFFNVFHPYSYSLFSLTKVMACSRFMLVKGDERIRSIWRLEKNKKIELKKMQNSEAAELILQHVLNMESERWRDLSILQKVKKGLSGIMNRISRW